MVFHLASVNGYQKVIDFLFAKLSSDPVEKLLSEKTKNGDTLFEVAFAHGHLAVIASLFAKLCPDTLEKLLSEKNNYGQTLFHLALMKGHQANRDSFYKSAVESFFSHICVC